mgnify:FL=1
MSASRNGLSITALLMLLCLAASAHAQAPPMGPPPAGQILRCESVNNRPQTCATPWTGDSRLIRQLSSTTSPCREGITWRSQRNQVWVTQGCRGEFGYAGAPPPVTPPISGATIRCESSNNQHRICPTPWQGHSRLVRQLSGNGNPCTEGTTWQSQQNQIFVNQGSRGEFASIGAQPPVTPPIGGSTIRCESTNNQHRICPTPWQGHSRLVRQLSSASAPCTEGTTWQSQQNQIFVNQGCRGEFESARGVTPPIAPLPPSPPGQRPIQCQSSSTRHQQCATPWPGRSRLVRQLTGAQCIEGVSWGTQPGQVWTSRGCGGEFLPDDGRPPHPNPGYSVTCASANNRLTTCSWNSRMGPPVLVEQLSSATCIEGRSWGYDQLHGLWVNNGCRARFGVQ